MEQHVKKKNSRWPQMYRKFDANSPSIMQSLDSMNVLESSKVSDHHHNTNMNSDINNSGNVMLEKEFESLNLSTRDNTNKSFQILNNKEELEVFISKNYT